MKLTAQAPCRVDMAGGTLDIWPLYLYHANAVTVNFAIDRYTRCTVETLDAPEISLYSSDLDQEERFDSLAALSDARKCKLPLAVHLLKFFAPKSGLRLKTGSEAPAGAGIAGSSSLMITVASALNKLTGAGYNILRIREIAQNVEARIIRVPTGCQDYYPAMYGGVSAIELRPDGLRRTAIQVDPADFNERIVLCYTGAPRNSGINNWEVTKAHIDGSKTVFRNFEQLAAIAHAMKLALEKADWKEVGRLLREEWSHRKKNAPGITTPSIDRLVEVAKKAGSWGAKACGAGGGGCVFLLVERGAKEKITAALAAAGAEILPVKVAERGVRVRMVE